MPKLTIDGREIEVAEGTSVLQAAERLGIEIPRFCYHEKLHVAGSCRLCLVEIEKMPKLVTSCTQPCAEGMVVHTQSPAVQKARQGVMELLLINHPLDCPVCDQGGACDLQDFAVAYGASKGRYRERKRMVKEKKFGPLIKTCMTRCIQCTRCIRFLNEICGTQELGGMGRGEKLEIGTYIKRALSSELSGNLIDVCPVGALTSKPAAAQFRPWELQSTDSIDVFDAVGSNIRIDTKGDAIMRVVPRANEAVNEQWISDKTRFAIDGLRYQRLDKPYIRRSGKLKPASWKEAIAVVCEKLRTAAPNRTAAIAGDMADCESMFALKSFMQILGTPNLDCRQDRAEYDVSTRAAYIMNSGIAGIEEADALVLIGADPRTEAPIINARIRKRWLKGGFEIGVIGPAVDLGYPYTHLGETPEALTDLLIGRPPFSPILRNAKKPMIILGAGALARPDGAAIHKHARELADRLKAVREDWNGFNVLQLAASRVGGLDLGFLPEKGGIGTRGILSGKMEVVWLLGADELDMEHLGKAFVVYQGHHGDKGAQRADVIFPGAAYTEKTALYVNTEGRPQLAIQAAKPPGEAHEDWKIIHAVAKAYGEALPFETIEQLREKMFVLAPQLEGIDYCRKEEWKAFGFDGRMSAEPFVSAIDNFYMTDPISRASPTMAKCTEEILPLRKKEAV